MYSGKQAVENICVQILSAQTHNSRFSFCEQLYYVLRNELAYNRNRQAEYDAYFNSVIKRLFSTFVQSGTGILCGDG